jgi:hypothetical protein
VEEDRDPPALIVVEGVLVKLVSKLCATGPGMVASACGPSYSGGGDRRIKALS